MPKNLHPIYLNKFVLLGIITFSVLLVNTDSSFGQEISDVGTNDKNIQYDFEMMDEKYTSEIDGPYAIKGKYDIPIRYVGGPTPTANVEVSFLLRSNETNSEISDWSDPETMIFYHPGQIKNISRDVIVTESGDYTLDVKITSPYPRQVQFLVEMINFNVSLPEKHEPYVDNEDIFRFGQVNDQNIVNVFSNTPHHILCDQYFVYFNDEMIYTIASGIIDEKFYLQDSRWNLSELKLECIKDGEHVFWILPENSPLLELNRISFFAYADTDSKLVIEDLNLEIFIYNDNSECFNQTLQCIAIDVMWQYFRTVLWTAIFGVVAYTLFHGYQAIMFWVRRYDEKVNGPTIHSVMFVYLNSKSKHSRNFGPIHTYGKKDDIILKLILRILIGDYNGIYQITR